METQPTPDPDERDDSSAAETPPPVPDDDDETPLGDTDQHSDASA